MSFVLGLLEKTERKGIKMTSLKHNCKDCQKRFVGCHSSCESYLKARAEFEAEKKKIEKNKKVDKEYQGFVVHSQDRRHGKETGRK